MHLAAYAFIARTVSAYQPRGPVVEIGSLDINGSVRPLFWPRPYLGVDRVAGPGVDVVADGGTYQPEAMPHTVVCCEVLEHLEAAAALVAQAGRVLAPGGLYLMTCAGTGRAPHSAVDGGALRAGEWYRNVSGAEFATWCRAAGLALLELEVDGGDLRAVATKPEAV
jgi:methyltransferase family protein